MAKRKIFEQAYELNSEKCFVVENFYGEKIDQHRERKKGFVAGTRPLKWKKSFIAHTCLYSSSEY